MFTIVVDLNNTIIDGIDRIEKCLPLKNTPGYLQCYKENIDLEKPRQEIISIINNLYNKFQIWIVTGRHISMKQETVEELKRFGVKYHKLTMKTDMTISDLKYKIKTITWINRKSRVIAIIDDDEKVLKSIKFPFIPLKVTDGKIYLDPSIFS